MAARLMFDTATARDLEHGLTLLRAHRRLSAGAAEILSVVSGSGRFRADQCSHSGSEVDHDDGMPVTPTLLTFDEVADTLRSSVSTVKRLVRSNQLRAVHVGNSTRVHSTDLIAYMDNLRADADPSVDAEMELR